MQRMAVLRLAGVVEPAGDEQAREAPAEALPLLAFGVVQGRAAEAAGALPCDRDTPPPERPDIQRAVGQRPEVQPAAGAEGDGPDTALDAVVEDDAAGTGELAQVAHQGRQPVPRQRPAEEVRHRHRPGRQAEAPPS